MSNGGGSGGGGMFGGFGSNFGPKGQYGAWPSCGCSSLVIVLAGIVLVCGGGLRFLGF